MKFSLRTPTLIAVSLVLLQTAVAQPWRPAIERFTLKNGLSVVLHRDAHLEKVAITMAFRAGSSLEPRGKSGIASILSSLLLGGGREFPQARLDDFQKLTQASISSLTDSDCLTITSSSHPSNLRTLLAIEADRLTSLPLHFDNSHFTAAIENMTADRVRSKTKPLYDLDLKVRAELYPKNHPYRKPPDGDPSELRAITLKDVRTFATRYIVPANASLTVGGDIDLDATRALITSLFEGIEPAGSPAVVPKVAPLKRIRDLVVMPDENYLIREEAISFTQLQLVFPTVPAGDVDAPTFEAIARILSGSMNSRLGMGLAEVNPNVLGVDAQQTSDQLGGRFTISVQCRHETALQGIYDRVMEILTDLAKNSVGPNEIAEARNAAEMQFYTRLEQLGGPGGRCDILNLGNLYFQDPMHDFVLLESLSSLQPRAVQRAVREYLHDANALIISIIPVGKTNQAVKTR